MRLYYGRSKTLKHDSGLNFRADLLRLIHGFFVVDHPEQFDIYDGRLKFMSKGSVMSLHGYYVGEIEYHALLYFRTRIKSDFTMLDVGAHHGLYSLVASSELQSAGHSGKIYAFEPDDRNYQYLKQNLVNNNLEQYVEHYNIGVSDTDGMQRFVVNNLDNSDNMLENIQPISVPQEQEIKTIETVTLDSFVHQNGIEQVDMIKIDTQGAEALVLKGSHEVISRNRPVIFLEVVRKQQYSRDALNVLKDLDYTFFGLRKNGTLCDFWSDEPFVSWDCVALPSESL